MKKFFAAAIILTSLASCRDMKEPEFRSIENVQVGKLGLGTTEVRLDVKYYNPNPFKATLKNASGEAWVDSVYLGKFIVDSSIVVQPKSDFLVPVKLKIDMLKFMVQSKNALEKKEAMIRVAGTARAGRGGFFKNFPLNYTGLQDLKKLFP